MTNNEAIGILAIVVETAKGRCFVTDEAISDAYDMAIKALEAQEAKAQLSAEGTTFDLISRQAAIDEIVNTISEIGLHDNSEVARYGATFRQHEIIDIIKGMPSAQPETNCSEIPNNSDLISRQAAIDAECEVCQIAPKKERGHNCTYYVHGCKEIECLRELPSAQPESEERTAESAQNVPKEDLISRKAAIDALWEIRQEEISDGRRFHNHCSLSTAVDVIKDLPSAQPEIKPISYQDCANAMMMMWIDNVLTDGEYRRIMDKLNDHESRRENR